MACRTARTWRKRMAQRCSINTQHNFFFTWCHLEFKVWVVMKLVPYDGVLVKEYVGEILKNFVKFQVVPSSMKVFTTNLNGPLSPICVAAGRGMTRPQQRWHRLAWEKVAIVYICTEALICESAVGVPWLSSLAHHPTHPLQWASYTRSSSFTNYSSRYRMSRGGGYSAWKLMGVCRWPLKIGPKKIEEFGAKKIDFCKNW